MAQGYAIKKEGSKLEKEHTKQMKVHRRIHSHNQESYGKTQNGKPQYISAKDLNTQNIRLDQYLHPGKKKQKQQMYSTSLKQREKRRKEMNAENIASGFKSRFLKKKM